MDYSQLIEDYLVSGGSSNKIEVSQLTDYSYIADVYYGDEEIENYLGSGSHIILSFSFIDVDSEDNSVGFEVTLESCTVPGINITSDNDFISSRASMSFALLEEVARVAQQFLRTARIDREIWLSLS